MVQSEMGAGGLGASQQTVQKGIDALSPAAVIMTGVAFGVNPKKQSVGDVLVSRQLLLYEFQRIGEDKGKFQIIPRGDRPHASPWLLDSFRSADLYLNESKFKVHFGLILSGEKLVDNLDFREQLLQFDPETIGGEMEGAGLYVACQDAKVDWILVKSICDWADGHKAHNKDDQQQIAAHNAASYVLYVLQHAPLLKKEEQRKRNTAQVMILLDKEIHEFKSDEQEIFKLALSRIVNINPDQIRFLRVTQDSVLLTVGMPEKAAKYLLSLFSQQASILQELRIAKLEISLFAETSCPKSWNPPRTPDPFIGREKDLKQIKAALSILPEASGVQSKIISIHGVPGVGKSTFAAWFANDQDILRAFPDAVLWSAFGQFHSSSDSDFEIRDRLKSWSVLLGDEHLNPSMRVNEMTERLAIMLRNRKALLICDDVWDVKHISAIRRLADGNVRLLVTSRLTCVAENSVSYPDGVFELKVFAKSDAIALLKIVAPEVVEKHPNETAALVQDLEYLPLAINVAGRLLRREMKAGLDVISLIEELRTEGEQLLKAAPPVDMMELIQEANSPTVAAWLKRSTKMMDEDTRQCFISLGYIAPKPATFGSDVLSLIWQDKDVDSVIRCLFDLGLIQTTNDQQYQMHALLVTLARSMGKEIRNE